MAELIESGWIADLILILMALEAVALLVLWQLLGRGIPPLPLGANMVAGASLVLALRSALTSSSTAAIAGFLLLSLLAHGVDLACRWSRRGTD
jgi:hypothetical protein